MSVSENLHCTSQTRPFSANPDDIQNNGRAIKKYAVRYPFPGSEHFLEHIKVNAANGTGGVAFSAANALVIINLCAEVFNRDRAGFARLDALHAADAAGLALLSCLGALVVVFAENRSLDGVQRKKVNELPRAGFNALFAGTTLARVDSCNTVANEDCIIRANLNAVSETDAAVDAGFRSAKKLCCHLAGANAAVLKLFRSVLPVALTHYGRNHRSDFSGLKTHDFSNLSGNIVSARNAKAALLCFAL